MSFKKLLANKKYPYFKKRKKLKFFWISKFWGIVPFVTLVVFSKWLFIGYFRLG